MDKPFCAAIICRTLLVSMKSRKADRRFEPDAFEYLNIPWRNSRFDEEELAYFLTSKVIFACTRPPFVCE